MPVFTMRREAAEELLHATQSVSWDNADYIEGVAELERVTQVDASTISHETASIYQIAIVQIEQFGSDTGLFINGDEIMTADPTNGDDHIALKATALSLCATLGIRIVEIPVAPVCEWQWAEIQENLILEGKLMKPAPQTHQSASGVREGHHA